MMNITMGADQSAWDVVRDSPREIQVEENGNTPEASRWEAVDTKQMEAELQGTGSESHPELPKVPPNRVLGVFGLSIKTTEATLRRVFSQYGEIEKVTLIVDKNTGDSKGFGFIYMENMDGAKKAHAATSGGLELDGRMIRVDYSMTSNPHAPTPGRYIGKPSLLNRGRRRDYGRNPDMRYDRGYNREDGQHFGPRYGGRHEGYDYRQAGRRGQVDRSVSPDYRYRHRSRSRTPPSYCYRDTPRGRGYRPEYGQPSYYHDESTSSHGFGTRGTQRYANARYGRSDDPHTTSSQYPEHVRYSPNSNNYSTRPRSR